MKGNGSTMNRVNIDEEEELSARQLLLVNVATFLKSEQSAVSYLAS